VPRKFPEMDLTVCSHFTELNDVLTEFYETHATVLGAEEWIEKHPYRESFADQNEKGWMEA
jgi:hypothetical protein